MTKNDTLHKALIHIDKLQHQLDSLQQLHSYKTEVLQQRLDQASDTVSNLSSLSTGFGTMYTIITIVITIVTVAIPLWVYLGTIKPWNKKLNQIPNLMDQRISIYLQERIHSEIDFALSNIESVDKFRFDTGMHLLNLRLMDLTEKDYIFRLLDLLQFNDLSLDNRTRIVKLLSLCPTNKAITKFFTDMLYEETKGAPFNFHDKAISYLLRDELREKAYFTFVDSIKKSPTKFNKFGSYLSLVQHIGDKETVLKFLNDKEVISFLKDGATPEIYNPFLDGIFLNIHNLTQEEKQDTELYKSKI